MHQDCQIRQTGSSTIRSQACESSITDVASFYKSSRGVNFDINLTTGMVQHDMGITGFTFFPFESRGLPLSTAVGQYLPGHVRAVAPHEGELCWEELPAGSYRLAHA